MREPTDILHIAPAIAQGAPAPEVLPETRRDIGRLIEGQPEEALRCLDAVLSGPEVKRAFEWLEAIGALGVWLPEVQALVGFHLSSPVHHKDLWTHTLEVLERTPNEPDLRWVALLHDVGKVATRCLLESKQVSFHGHERLGAWLSEGIGARFAMNAPRRARIAFIIEHHARINAYEAQWTDRAIRRLIRDSGEHLEDMLRFSSADYTTKRPRRAKRIRAQLEELNIRIEGVKEELRRRPSLPPRLGKQLCADLGLSPGPDIGLSLAWLEEQIASERLLSNQEPSYYIGALEKVKPWASEGLSAQKG